MLQNFYNTTFFHKDGSPKFVRVYYDKRFTVDPSRPSLPKQLICWTAIIVWPCA